MLGCQFELGREFLELRIATLKDALARVFDFALKVGKPFGDPCAEAVVALVCRPAAEPVLNRRAHVLGVQPAKFRRV